MSSQVNTTQPRGITLEESPDVWDLGQIVLPTQAVAVQTYYAAHVPRRFRPVGGLRVSFTNITAGEIEYAVSVGNDGLLMFDAGFCTHTFEEGVDSFMIPASDFAPWVAAEGLPPGAAMRLGISQIDGVGYGFALYGLRMQFLGYWDN